MTVRDWLESRSPKSPPALLSRVLEALGADADAPEARLADVAIAAAERTLSQLIAEQRFERAGAVDLLAADALMTYAYEHAAGVASPADVEDLANRGIRLLGHLTPDHV